MTNLGEIVGGRPVESRNELILGVCMGIDWPSQIARVRIPGGTADGIPARMSGQVPRVGESVWVSLVGDLALTMGRPSRVPVGTVLAGPVNGTVQVRGDDQVTYGVGFPTGYTPASGHRVLLNWDNGGHIIARIDVEVPVVVPPSVPGTPTNRSKTFNAIDSGSFRAGGWQSGSVYFGSSFPSAGYFYGTQIADSIPDGATITGIRIYLEVLQSSGQATMPLSLHTSSSRPSGGLALDQTTSLGAMPAGFRDNVALPTGWGDLLKTGARFGVGTSGSGLRVLKGQNALASAGAITIDWKE